jgi:hypothetical protein
MYLEDISMIRAVEWGSSHLWDIRFKDDEGLKEFANWFPASNVEEGLFSANMHTFEAAGSSFAIPKSQGLETIKITFLDSVQLTVHSWLRDWVKGTIYHHGRYVARIGDTGVLRRVQIKKVDKKHKNLASGMKEGTYSVYPQGPFHFAGDSEGNIVSNTVEFVIVKEVLSDLVVDAGTANGLPSIGGGLPSIDSFTSSAGNDLPA